MCVCPALSSETDGLLALAVGSLHPAPWNTNGRCPYFSYILWHKLIFLPGGNMDSLSTVCDGSENLHWRSRGRVRAHLLSHTKEGGGLSFLSRPERIRSISFASPCPQSAWVPLHRLQEPSAHVRFSLHIHKSLPESSLHCEWTYFPHSRLCLPVEGKEMLIRERGSVTAKLVSHRAAKK